LLVLNSECPIQSGPEGFVMGAKARNLHGQRTVGLRRFLAELLAGEGVKGWLGHWPEGVEVASWRLLTSAEATLSPHQSAVPSGVR